jgi:butyrate kinase
MQILVINPGATSTKVAVFDNDRVLIQTNIEHDEAVIKSFPSVGDQLGFRTDVILTWLSGQQLKLSDFSAIAGRGGLIRHVESGTYKINSLAVEDANAARYGDHPANLGIIIADRLARKAGIPAFFTDPVSTDEWPDFVHLSGFKPIPRRSFFHALNQKATAKEAAFRLGKPYEQSRLIVSHMGGGVSVAAHLNGRIVDVFNVLDEGAMSLDRSGALPVQGLIDYCFSGLDKATVKKNISRAGGLSSYLGLSDFREIERLVQSTDEKAKLAYQAYIWQLVKDIGSMAAVLEFNVDAVVFTGGIANATLLIDKIRPFVERLAPILLLPDEYEMAALAKGAAQALAEGAAKNYPDGEQISL